MIKNTVKNEIWKDIKGYEGLYQISNLGRVKSLRRIRNGDFRYEIKEKILKYRINNIGYPVVYLRLDMKNKQLTIHRLLAIAFIPNPNNNSDINHINGNKSDNRLENLEWVSRSQNIKHAYDNGLKRRGENHYYSKLSESQVLDIRYRLSKGESGVSISKLYNVTSATICDINKKKSWGHLN